MLFTSIWLQTFNPNTDPADVNFTAEHCAVSTSQNVMNGRGCGACWLSDCVHPEGKMKSLSMHTGPWVKQLTYKCSLAAVLQTNGGMYKDRKN